jgi:hypothetical protein
MKSATHLQALVKSRSWDKEILLWAGSEKSLQQALGTDTFIVLDLLDLFDPSSLPLDEDATRDQLRERLRSRLKEIHSGPDNRAILVVKSIGLLARYSVGLTVFYDWFVSSFTLVILLLEGGQETTEWPEEVRCESNRLLKYFSEPGMVKEVFTTNG